MTTASAERRTAILRAAARLFEHYGHGKTTIADVAREAQVGVGTVYLEFPSKEAIIEELSLSTHVGVLDAMRAASKESEDPKARFAAVLMARTRCFLELRARGQHACELVLCKTESVRTAHRRFRDQERALLASIIDDGQRSGAFAAGAPSGAAALVQRAFASLSPPWIFGNDDDAMRATADLCNLVLEGLSTRGAAPRQRATTTRRSRR
ncbi:MAG TPA: helix-turn-helix domain-containing protein [Labilithrix sp.]|jgi:AcrR family transcriptional regulator|nr:helix-turn-helix domain-containing protein [Labilithrix sp.]